MPPAVAKANELIAKIQETIEDDVPEWATDKAEEFFDDVLEKTKDIATTIERTERASDGQIQALENMLAGVRKWIPGG